MKAKWHFLFWSLVNLGGLVFDYRGDFMTREGQLLFVALGFSTWAILHRLDEPKF